ncbi:carboxylesterase/lipase family protein [Nocardia sp. NPDC058658]|uniref:carboxylesterase/lipase family protein n=1 Tax=Nocardia sp. NPDC058658 TaxID=3346580 RepID=UPI003656F821
MKNATIFGLIIAGAAALTVACGTEAESVDAAVVQVESGAVRGSVATEHRVFQGIPYAAAPTGDFRWASPRPVPGWSGIRDAAVPGPACPQVPQNPLSVASENEDCLYLNVTAPTAAQRSPVLVYIHGGDNIFGTGSTYDATRLATQGDAVVVTLNYRLGVLGYLAHSDGLSGDYGMQDQRAALRWVRDNIAAFGGDPGNVTLFGQSGGGYATCAHLASDESAGLFHRAIMQSSPCLNLRPGSPEPAGSGPEQPRDRQAARRQGFAIADRMGCPATAGALNCLRHKDVAELLEVTAEERFASVVDGAEHAFVDGKFARVPVLLGINKDEERFRAFAIELQNGHPLTLQEYREQLTQLFGDRADRVAAQYPCDGDNCSAALGDSMTDYAWARPAGDTFAALAHHTPTYAYEFADRDAPWFASATGQQLPSPSFDVGAYHIAELPYLFDVAYSQPLPEVSRDLSDQMIAYWSRFAHTGDPNAVGSPPWPKFDGTTKYVQSLAPNTISRVDFDAEHRTWFWRSFE